MPYEPLPQEIIQHVARLEEQGWPAWVEFPRGEQLLWTSIDEATVAHFEQAVELETRRARKAIDRFFAGSKSAARRAASCINRANAFREMSLHRQGAEVTQAKLPFPLMSPEEMSEHLRKERDP